MSTSLTLHSSGEKSSIRKWYEKLAGGTPLARTKTHVAHGAHAIRATGEGVIVGGVLGLLDCKLKTGLDVEAFTDKTGRIHHVPIDGVAAALGVIGGTMMAHEEYGKDLINAGAAAASVFSYRKTRDFVATKMRLANAPIGYQQTIPFAQSMGIGTQPQSTAHGEIESGQDPILALANTL